MKKKNIYKPRFKIAFQAKSKVWAYKNSRLRYFYSIRCKRLYRDGFFRKNALAATTLKWTVARRFIKPYSHHILGARGKAQYKHLFYLKQQVRHFYGKLTEVAFRSIYKAHLLNTWDRNKSFFGSLEQRADMFLYRMRLLPTIYACNQFVHHQGLLINRKRIEKCPSALIRIGHSVSLPRMYWRIMARYMICRVYFRVFGKFRAKIRLRKAFLRKARFLLKKKRSKRRWKKSKQKWRWRSYFWRIKSKALRTIFEIRRRAQALDRIYTRFGILYTGKHCKYTYSTEVVALLLNLLHYRTKILNIVHTLIFHYKQFFLLLRRYGASLRKHRLDLRARKALEKRMKKAGVTSSKKGLKSPTKKTFEQSARIYILLTIKNYLITQEFTSHINALTDQCSKLEATIGLEIIDTMSYDAIIGLYDLDIVEIFEKDTVSLDELVLHLKTKWREVLSRVHSIVTERFLLADKLRSYSLGLRLRKIMKKFKKRWKSYYDSTQGKKVFKPSTLTYFLLSRKYKQQRKKHVLRLKKVHWYIPKYIHFDVRSLRAILLYVPRTKEIVFPFKCSVSKIFSFYKSLGV